LLLVCCSVLHLLDASYLFFFQAEDGIRDFHVTGVQTCALPISPRRARPHGSARELTTNESARRISRESRLGTVAPHGGSATAPRCTLDPEPASRLPARSSAGRDDPKDRSARPRHERTASGAPRSCRASFSRRF